MKKLTIFFLLLIGLSTFISCDSIDEAEEDTETQTEWECGTHNGNTLFTGPQGGCYYKNSNGNKTYVDRSECNC